jgi:ABC-2 type transport system permease protein
MTAIAAKSQRPARARSHRLRDVAVLTGRNLTYIAREPLRLSDVTIQPVVFTLLFIYIFGSGVSLPGGYKAFAVAGLSGLSSL